MTLSLKSTGSSSATAAHTSGELINIVLVDTVFISSHGFHCDLMEHNAEGLRRLKVIF